MDGEGTHFESKFDSCNQVTVEDEGKDNGVEGNVEKYATASDGSRVRGPKTEEDMRKCTYCDFQADDWPAFARHVFKPYHIKKMAEVYKIKLPKETRPSLSCDICSVTCFGHQSFNAHLLGGKHQKAIQQRADAKNERSAGGGQIKNTQFGNIQSKKPYDRPHKSAKGRAIGAKVFASYPQPLIGLEYVTEVQVAGKNPRYECSLCDAKFEHDLKFPHLVGQKHRMNVLKIKRPDFVRELHPTSKKRSELTAALLKESIALEICEGRKEVKIRVEKPPSFVENFSKEARRGSRGLGKREDVGFSTRGSRSNRGTSYTMGGYGIGSDTELYNHPPSSGLLSSYESYGNEEYGTFSADQFSYEVPYKASFEYSNYNRNYLQGLAQEYPENSPSLFGEHYSQSPLQIELPQIKAHSGVSPGLANVIGDLTKLVKNDEDASVALQVSNTLTKALLQYRLNDARQDFN